MKIPKFNSPQEVLALLYRRKWVFLFGLVTLFTTAATVSLLLPDIYSSQTLILVEPRDVPDNLVRDLLTIKTQQRLAAIQQAVLSRSALLQLVSQFENELLSIRSLDNDGKIARVRSRISVSIATDRTRRDSVVTYFTIGFSDENPAVAQKIAARLAALFIEEENKTREDKVYGTIDFLRSEKEKVGAELLVLEEELARYRQIYRYELPDQRDANLRTLDRLQMQLQGNQEAYDRQLTLRVNLESQLLQTPRTLVDEDRSVVDPQTNRVISPLVDDYKTKQAELRELRTRYTDQHPDVTRLERELDQLKSQIPEGDLVNVEDGVTAPRVVTRPNPAYQQLEGRLKEVDTELNISRRSKEQVLAEMERLGDLVNRSAIREQDLAALERKYEDLRANHADLEGKLTEAELAGSLETRQKGEQFTVVDYANLPLHPSKPNRTMFLLGGLLGSLILAVGFALLVDFADQKLWSYSEIEDLGVRVLVEIPEIISESELDSGRWRVRTQIAMFAVFCLVCVGGAFFVLNTPEINEKGSALLAQLVKW